MTIPDQTIEVVVNKPGELVLKVGVITNPPDNPFIYFKHNSTTPLCNDDIAAVVQFFCGRG